MLAYAKTTHPNGTCEHQLTSEGQHFGTMATCGF